MILKLECANPPPTSSRPEQKTSATPFAGIMKEEGTNHFVGFDDLSVRYQPAISMSEAVGL